MSSKDVLGVDVGGVILDFIPHKESELSFHGDRFLETPQIAEAIESLTELNLSRFKNRIFLVSRYGPHGPNRVLEWLRHRDFFTRTGIPESHYHPCAERDEKVGISKDLGITHFVDDRAEVLSYMRGVVPYLYLFQSLDEKEEDFSDIRSEVEFVSDWKELKNLLLKKF